MIEFDKEASSIGACCPVPLIKLEQAVKTMQKGEVLRIVGDDPIFESGVRDYCQAKGYQVLEVIDEGSQTTIFLKL